MNRWKIGLSEPYPGCTAEAVPLTTASQTKSLFVKPGKYRPATAELKNPDEQRDWPGSNTPWQTGLLQRVLSFQAKSSLLICR